MESVEISGVEYVIKDNKLIFPLSQPIKKKDDEIKELEITLNPSVVHLRGIKLLPIFQDLDVDELQKALINLTKLDKAHVLSISARDLMTFSGVFAYFFDQSPT